jgi:hypothetical protein
MGDLRLIGAPGGASIFYATSTSSMHDRAYKRNLQARKILEDFNISIQTVMSLDRSDLV